MNKNIIKIIESFPVEKESSFEANKKLDSLFKALKDQLEILTSNNNLKNFKIDYSYGKGQWAIVPWIAIMNKKITETVSEGVYIVILFSSDGKSIYLTLNQGTGGINKAQVNIDHDQTGIQYQNDIPKETGYIFGELKAGSLDVKKRNRPRAYEKACIYSKKFTIESLKKISNKEFETDILTLLNLYFGKNNLSERSNNSQFSIDAFSKSINESGLVYSDQLITRFISSLLTKPFLILTGLSGSGKTKLAQTFVQWICQEKSQYCLTPVGADWINREPLLGYPNALNSEEYIKPHNGILNLIIQANNNSTVPHFLILDEMNLSHVERYFADFLSIMESKEKISLHTEVEKLKSGVPHEIKWPNNLFIIGTVNIDETTYMFSPKVLDRANVIEFRISQDEMKNYLSEPKEIKELNGEGKSMGEDFVSIVNNRSQANSDKITKTLNNFFIELKKIGAEFGYRTASEIQTLIGQIDIVNPKYVDKENEKIDIAIMQKMLPKLHGSRSKLTPILRALAILCYDEDEKFNDDDKKDIFDKEKNKNRKVAYTISLEKITRMYNNAISNGFTSYAEA